MPCKLLKSVVDVMSYFSTGIEVFWPVGWGVVRNKTFSELDVHKNMMLDNLC